VADVKMNAVEFSQELHHLKICCGQMIKIASDMTRRITELSSIAELEETENKKEE
jgi:hypothetical protein